MSVNFVNSDEKLVKVSAIHMSQTVLNPDHPTVVLVIRSNEGAYLGHLETNPEGAHTLSEEIRQAAEAASREAAEAAQTTLEEE